MFLGLIVSALMMSMVTHYHYSAFGQSSTTITTTPAGPATTTPPPLSQSNTTSSSSVDEGVVVVNSLLFEPDGTGLIRLRDNGTVGPLIPFTHNLTEANGYTVYSSVPFFANNGSAVDLNGIDFSSQIIIDPSANVTLPARPMLSPAVVPDISSLPSQTGASPSITTPPVQPQQQSGLITQLIGVRNEVIPLSAQNIQFQQQDPSFAKLVQVINDCMNFVVAQNQEGHINQLDNNRKFTCDEVISQGVEQFCEFSPTSDIVKCEEANTMHLIYMVTAGASGFPT